MTIKTQPKRLPDAPRATLTLRTFDAPDWRWPIPDGTKLRMRKRVNVGMPDEMREAFEEAKKRTGLSMSEIGRRCFRQLGIARVRPNLRSPRGES